MVICPLIPSIYIYYYQFMRSIGLAPISIIFLTDSFVDSYLYPVDAFERPRLSSYSFQQISMIPNDYCLFDYA